MYAASILINESHDRKKMSGILTWYFSSIDPFHMVRRLLSQRLFFHGVYAVKATSWLGCFLQNPFFITVIAAALHFKALSLENLFKVFQRIFQWFHYLFLVISTKTGNILWSWAVYSKPKTFVYQERSNVILGYTSYITMNSFSYACMFQVKIVRVIPRSAVL